MNTQNNKLLIASPEISYHLAKQAFKSWYSDEGEYVQPNKNVEKDIEEYGLKPFQPGEKPPRHEA
jgi:hypothetical protein